MKIRVAVVALLALLVLGAGTAQAWFMTFNQAKNATRNYAQQTCVEIRDCRAWAVGPCYRQGPSLFKCYTGHYFRTADPEIEEVCNTPIQWGAGRDQRIALKTVGNPRCYTQAARR